tara:strand:+ start:5639 stop:5941 length:303 start_codon:yes stop_codon:yes gene_type:complete
MKISNLYWGELILKIQNNSNGWTSVYLNIKYDPIVKSNLIFTLADSKETADSKFKVFKNSIGELYFNYSHLYAEKIEKLQTEDFKYFVISKRDNKHFILR